MNKETGLIFSTEMALANTEHRKSMTRRTRGLEWMNQDPDSVEFLRMEGDKAVFRQLRLSPFASEMPPLRSCPEAKTTGEYPNLEVLFYVKCPFGQIGDGIWQREAFRIGEYTHKKRATIIYRAGGEKTYFGWNDWLERNTRYAASNIGDGERWRSPMFMPRFASRFTPPITELRAERLQNITEKDAFAEGFKSIFPMLDFEYIKDATPTNPKVDIDTLKFSPDSFLLYWQDKNADRGYDWDLNKWDWVIGYENG